MSSTVQAVLGRLAVSLLIAFVTGFAINESSYWLVNGSQQQPQEYTLEIPAGTSQSLAAGEIVASLPASMSFVEGDKLVVKNYDSVSHQLGPIWVPPGASGTLSLERPQNYTMDCSFSSGQKMGLNVTPRVNLDDRLVGLFSIGLPSAVLLWLFSFVLFPIKGLGE